MRSELLLYHGSGEIVERPAFGKGRKHNDYGSGFYCTEDEELAREWACNSLRGGFVNRYTFDMGDLRVLDLNSEGYTLLNWIAVLVSHRLFRPTSPIAGKAMRYLDEHFSVNVEAYDVIRGYRADDAYFDFADAFLNNTITVEQLSQAMRLGKLGEQIVLKSSYAFSKIQYDGCVPADGQVYYPARKARNDAAQKEYHSLTETFSDGLYMIDIIRGGLTNDDESIRRILSV